MLRKTPTLVLALVSCVLLAASKELDGSRQSLRKFPDGFLFGAATASYQVEGAWDADGKSENIWDHMTHKIPCETDNCDNGDVANDSYNNYKRDVEMVRELGLDVYRLSLSWTRLMPTSFPDDINQPGVDYYNNLIDELLKYNIKPLVTLYHWDLPQKLSLMGGWTNPHIVDWYSDFSRIAFELFGDRVKHWITINEPQIICQHGYGDVTKAPQLNIPGYAEYICTKNILLAHAAVYHMYDKEFRPVQEGTIGITLNGRWYEPDTEADTEIANQALQFEFGLYAHPIFSESGDWPLIIKERIAAKSAAQGFKRSRLPEFSPEEIDLVRGSSDFFGFNHYTTVLAYRNESADDYNNPPSYDDDKGSLQYQPSEWDTGAASKWLKDIPWGFYKLLNRIREDYNSPKIFVTENGYSTYGGLDDEARINYLRGYLNALLDAIDDGCNISVYCHWSMMDNFEWMRGYAERFGLYEVDYTSPERTRTPRKSAFVYKEIVRSRSLDPNYEPDTTVMTIDEGH